MSRKAGLERGTLVAEDRAGSTGWVGRLEPRDEPAGRIVREGKRRVSEFVRSGASIPGSAPLPQCTWYHSVDSQWQLKA